jgi:hypothetical protein
MLRRPVGVAMAAALMLTSCTSYVAKPVTLQMPNDGPTTGTVPGTNIKVMATAYDTPQQIHSIFAKHGLWRGHVLPVKIQIVSTDANAVDFLVDSAYIKQGDTLYPAIPPNEAFDVSWNGANPHARLENNVFNGAVILFTIVTLGLGSLIWVIPSPFEIPAPNTNPYGRDLNYKTLTGNVSIVNGTFRGDFMFFALGSKEEMQRLDQAQLVLHFHQAKGGNGEQSLTFNLRGDTAAH